MPVGRWVMRIAESVLLTCWPPAGCAKCVGFQIGRIDLDIVDLGQLGQDGHGRRRGMDAALRFGCRYALYAVRAGFELESRIRALAFDARDDFL